jgi:hypothetical protein
VNGSRAAWSRPTSVDEAHRRASGRRQYNSIRRVRRLVRRQEVAQLLGELGYRHGVQAEIAKRLGVPPATISRDVAAVLAAPSRCPRCGYERVAG